MPPLPGIGNRRRAGTGASARAYALAHVPMPTTCGAPGGLPLLPGSGYRVRGRLPCEWHQSLCGCACASVVQNTDRDRYSQVAHMSVLVCAGLSAFVWVSPCLSVSVCLRLLSSAHLILSSLIFIFSSLIPSCIVLGTCSHLGRTRPGPNTAGAEHGRGRAARRRRMRRPSRRL